MKNMNKSKKSMYLLTICFVSILSLVACKNIQTKKPEIIFHAPTKEEAFDLAILSIRDLSWCIQNKCRLDLPEHEAFKKLYENPEALLDYDFDHLKNIFYTEIYNSAVFNKGLEEIQKTHMLIKASFEKLAYLHEHWKFKLMPQYKVILTLYGTRGSYDPLTGQIILRTSATGIKRAGRTIIHEIVHIGIEENIVKKYKLTQKEKERLVDLICSIYLKDILPTYIPEPKHLTDDRIDEFINEKVIKENLPKAIESYIAKYPRKTSHSN